MAIPVATVAGTLGSNMQLTGEYKSKPADPNVARVGIRMFRLNLRTINTGEQFHTFWSPSNFHRLLPPETKNIEHISQ
jgi:hypothetical protein